ncbi:MAG: accessory Sec system translocase SecA2 [Acidobacteriota bacterium]
MSLMASNAADRITERCRRLRRSPVEYDLGPYRAALARVNAVRVEAFSDAALQDLAGSLRSSAAGGAPLDTLLPEMFALVCETSRRVLGMRPFEVQMMAGIALHQGRLVQMQTGEGKTLAAVPPASLNALTGSGVHIFTANDYLAERDARWMGPLYRFIGLSVGFIRQGMSSEERRRAYASDVTYVTAKEAGFDFLRDHIAGDRRDQVHRPLQHVIVDEADFILIDEARVPLVIAGSSPGSGVDHARLAGIVRPLRNGRDYLVQDEARNVTLTDAGFARLEGTLGVPSLHLPEQHLLLSAVSVALHAEVLLHRNRDYIVRDGRIELVDEFTGRVADNRRWPHGIQAAVEAKEGLEVHQEGRILASIPIQHFVRLYPRIAGMTATAEPAAEEIHELYGMPTVVFPPHRPCIRRDEDDVVFTHRDAKMRSLVEEIRLVHASGRPILVGTASVRESEELAQMLREHGLKCCVLNARNDAREAQIIAQAGRLHALTISTNMAGRGTDIALGGGDHVERDRVLALGGLYVIGTNRHESLRIDLQLRGRAGRQGDPGSSRFFISLEDDLVSRYGVKDLVPPSHWPERRETPVDDGVLRREIARAQRIIEGQNSEIRKTLWQYSALVEKQRQEVHRLRQDLLAGLVQPGICAGICADRYKKLRGQIGEEELEKAERVLAIRLLDRSWSDHLATIEDIREGIHLQRYGGGEPLDEFVRLAGAAFSDRMREVEDSLPAAFERLSVTAGVIDLEAVGLTAPSATWTYMINDNPFSSLGVSLIACRNIGFAAWAGIVAMLHAPLALPGLVLMCLNRLLRRRRRK